MSCRCALALYATLFTTVRLASSCNAAGMQTCNQDYLAAIPNAMGKSSCEVMDTMLSCLNTACAGCPDAVKQQFNAIVSPLKSGSSCKAGATCANSTICAASEPLTCSSAGSSSGSDTSGTTRTSCKLVLLVCILMTGLVDLASSCNAGGMQKCNEDYLAAVPGAMGNQSCTVMDTLLSCLNTACAGCPDAVKQQFNMIVTPVKSGSSCGAGSTCANSTICAASEPLTCNAAASSPNAPASGSVAVCVGVVAMTAALVSLMS